MPHADTAFIPEEIDTKAKFYDHVYEGISALVAGHTYWVSNLANASALLYNSYLNCTKLYGVRADGEPVVNWAGFYLQPPERPTEPSTNLLLGPFQGRPACQFIRPLAGKGVCADTFVNGITIVVPDVHAYPGHIACDALSQSEIVLPLRWKDSESVVGVLDLDSTVKGTFDDEDRTGLERIAELLRIPKT